MLPYDVTNGIGVDLVTPYSVGALQNDVDPHKDLMNFNGRDFDTSDCETEVPHWIGELLTHVCTKSPK